MKPRLAAILSIAGVLSAGSAAALVNTRVLEGGGQDDNAIAAPPSIIPATTPASTPTGNATARSTTPTAEVTAPPVVDPGSLPPTSAPSAASGVYQLGDGGTVTLSTAGDVLRIVSVDPAPGWEVHKAENDSAHSVEIQLRTDEREVQFEASLLFGVVNTSLETSDD